ncbi:MAG: BMP family ABC transporter substrate-binding protein [Candidatus Pacebacteria bacterium]|nr:BMP family ABC transporter substrate-binding protein [Candidatus Paceibacterota bacterium]
MMRKRLVKLIITVFALAGIVSGSAEAIDRVAFVYVTPLTAVGWSHQHDLGRLEMEKNLQGRVSTSFVDNVAEGADAERVIRQLAQAGNRIIVTTSFGYMNPTAKIAEEFPQVSFLHVSGYRSNGTNFANYNGRYYEARYLNGVIAGGMSKTNLIGYIAGFPIPEVVMGINAFMLGARSVNPKAEIRVVWLNSWYDPVLEKQAGLALIAQGADILANQSSSTATVQTAEANGIYAFSYSSDMSAYAPRAQLSGTIQNWGDYYTAAVKQILDGKGMPKNIWGGMRENMVSLAPLNPAIPPALAKRVNELKAGIIAGKLQPFAGEIRDQRGKIRIAAGKVASDDDLNRMDYFVEGVTTEFPK